MSESERSRSGIRARGEEALGDLAQALLENPLFSQALGRALGAGERAVQAQRSAMGALNIPSGADLERIEQRLRSLSNRLESLEDRLDDLADDVAASRRRAAAAEPRLGPERQRLRWADRSAGRLRWLRSRGPTASPRRSRGRRADTRVAGPARAGRGAPPSRGEPTSWRDAASRSRRGRAARAGGRDQLGAAGRRPATSWPDRLELLERRLASVEERLRSQSKAKAED